MSIGTQSPSTSLRNGLPETRKGRNYLSRAQFFRATTFLKQNYQNLADMKKTAPQVADICSAALGYPVTIAHLKTILKALDVSPKLFKHGNTKNTKRPFQKGPHSLRLARAITVLRRVCEALELPCPELDESINQDAPATAPLSNGSATVPSGQFSAYDRA